MKISSVCKGFQSVIRVGVVGAMALFCWGGWGTAASSGEDVPGQAGTAKTFTAKEALLPSKSFVPTTGSAVTVAQAGSWPGYGSGEARSVSISGRYAYVAVGGGGLAVVDISDPVSPVSVGGCDTSGYACGVEVVGNLAYVADYGAGLQVANFTIRVTDNDGFSSTKGFSMTIDSFVLRIQKQGTAGMVTLSWPAAAVGYGLQVSTTLPNPTWLPVLDTAVPAGDQIQVRLAPASQAQFFRLWKP